MQNLTIIFSRSHLSCDLTTISDETSIFRLVEDLIQKFADDQHYYFIYTEALILFTHKSHLTISVARVRFRARIAPRCKDYHSIFILLDLGEPGSQC